MSKHLYALLTATSVLILGNGCISVDLSSLLNDQLEEITLEEPEKRTDNKIAVLDISGTIASEGGGLLGSSDFCSPAHVRAVLKQIEADDDVKALLLRIDSPGGRVTETDLIHHEIKQYAKRTGIPVYASIVTIGCSGGYYIAMGADKVYAEPTAVTGSIGVIMALPKFKGLAEKIGYEQEVIKSGQMKDMGNPMRDMRDEERVVLQSVVDALHSRFVTVVADNRKGIADRAALNALADGRIYTADQARDAKLIDGVCHLDQVLGDLKEAAGLKHAKVVMYAYHDDADANLYSPARASSTLAAPLVNVSVPDLPAAKSAGFFYLWLPGQP